VGCQNSVRTPGSTCFAGGTEVLTPHRDRFGYDQQQLTHLRRLHAARRLDDQPRQFDAAGGDSSLQPRAGDAHLVRLRKRKRCSVERPKAVGVRLPTATASILRGAEARKGPERRVQHPGLGARERRGRPSFTLSPHLLLVHAPSMVHARTRISGRAAAGNRMPAEERSTPTFPESAFFQAKTEYSAPTGEPKPRRTGDDRAWAYSHEKMGRMAHDSKALILDTRPRSGAEGGMP
jgi:hypothetical protein